MYKLPELTRLSTTRTVLSAFRGYNNNLSIGEDENSDELNLTAENYPVMSVRKPYGIYYHKGKINVDGEIYKDASRVPDRVTYFCDSGCKSFYRDPNKQYIAIEGEEVFVGEVETPAYQPRDQGFSNKHGLYISTEYGYKRLTMFPVNPKTGYSMVRMGNKIIFPEKKTCYTLPTEPTGTADGKYEKLEQKNEISCSENNITFELCDSDFNVIDSSDVVAQATEPDDTTKKWIDTSVTPHVLKVYSTSQGEWVQKFTTYIKVSGTDITDGFEKGDGVKITGILKNSTSKQAFDLYNDKISVVQSVNKVYLYGNTEELTVLENVENRDVVPIKEDLSAEEIEEINNKAISEDGFYVRINNQTYRSSGALSSYLKPDGTTDFEHASIQITDEIGNPLNITVSAGASIKSIGEDSFVFIGITDSTYTQTSGTLTFSRDMPEMDFIFECNNRLWGCGKNEIYASKLGDPKNWNVFEGIASDSFAASLGSSESFTGGCSYNGNPLFFREKEVIKVYGNYPAQYQVQTLICDGIKYGCSESLCNIGGYLYYYSPAGLSVYSGSYPQNINGIFGGEMFTEVKCASIGKNLYMAATDGKGEQYVYNLDTQSGIWHKNKYTEKKITQLFSTGTNILFIANNTAYRIFGDEEPDNPEFEKPEDPYHPQYGSTKDYFVNEKVKWKAESGNLDGSFVDRKYVQRLLIKYVLNTKSNMRVFISYDNGGWECVFNAPIQDLNSLPLSLNLRRCDHYRLKFEGEGPCEVYSITKTLKQGSDKR